MMKWKYYNHAAIPTTAPHEEVDLTPIYDGSIWKMEGKPLVARWTSDFDCGRETNWWYVVKDTPIVLEELSSHSRKHIRQGLKKCEIKIIDSEIYAEELYECSCAAFSKYVNATNESSKEAFIRGCRNTTDLYWGGFEKESGKLIGYLIIRENKEFVDIVTAKFNPTYLNTHISDALYYTAINFYLLNPSKVRYVSSGQRNINHVTNTQEYKEQTLGYRKAYCRLNVKYRFPLGFAVKVLYPWRHWLEKFDEKRIVHLIIALLKMEEVVRER